MMNPDFQNKNLIPKLTALWAISESGLGGVFHALKLPFSGLFLGSFAVMIVTFIALHSTRKFRDILQATLIVVLIKALASPHSPITAYIAVLFQGTFGALVYALFPVHRLSAILFGVVALMESGFQKLLKMVLIFGENIWIAFQSFFTELADKFRIQVLQDLPYALIMGYLAIYFLGGIAAGIIAFRLPKLIRNQYDNLPQNILIPNENLEILKKKKTKFQFLGLLFILLFIVSVFVFSGSREQAFYAILRTFAALGVFYFILRPLFQYFLQRWKTKQTSRLQQPLQQVLDFVPGFKNNAMRAYQIAVNESSSFKKIRTFLLTWMALSLYSE